MIKYALALILALLLPTLLIMWFIPGFGLVLLGSMLLAYVLDPIVNWLEKRICRRSFSAFILTFILPNLLLLWFLFVLPDILNQLIIITKGFPALYDQALAPILESRIGVRLDWSWVMDHLPRWSTDYLTHSFESILKFNLYALLFIVIAFILLRDWERIIATLRTIFYDLTPDAWNDEIDQLFMQIGQSISRLIRGQLQIGSILAIYYGLAFHILGTLAEGDLRFFSVWMLIGIVTGYLNILPYIGVPMGGLVAGVLALMTFKFEVLWIYIALLITVTLGVTIDHKILTPAIIGRTVKVYELFVYLTIYLGGTLGGVVGVIFALPAMVIINEIVKHFYKHWLLHRHVERESVQRSGGNEPQL
ncbi:MAG: AI-2E family transporter [Gammaproteobacteria bacterium]|nr:AI-2E family transporter [Gammaproteobacteria bacterium]